MCLQDAGSEDRVKSTVMDPIETTNLPAPREHHLSPHAYEQLLAAGVAPQLLELIQGSSGPASTVMSTPKTRLASRKSSTSAAFRKRAHLLRSRQEQILKRITGLEDDQAHQSGSQGAEMGLRWQEFTTSLQVLQSPDFHVHEELLYPTLYNNSS